MKRRDFFKKGATGVLAACLLPITGSVMAINLETGEEQFIHFDAPNGIHNWKS
ncbi:hypothetical protein [Polaribacter sp.]|uniref:hypothetical protein n=1 Tax=Polaribacter sp. TaxID=1920175 RepID=UPI003EF0B995